MSMLKYPINGYHQTNLINIHIILIIATFIIITIYENISLNWSLNYYYNIIHGKILSRKTETIDNFTLYMSKNTCCSI